MSSTPVSQTPPRKEEDYDSFPYPDAASSSRGAKPRLEKKRITTSTVFSSFRGRRFRSQTPPRKEEDYDRA